MAAGRITTDAPNVRWATDGAKVWTADDGWLWMFTTMEHWNAECLGHHVCKIGDRFAAYEPVAQAVVRVFGTTALDAARGVELRHDHGSQYLFVARRPKPLKVRVLLPDDERFLPRYAGMERSNRLFGCRLLVEDQEARSFAGER